MQVAGPLIWVDCRLSGGGVVAVPVAVLDRYEVPRADEQTLLEYWVPAEDLEEFNERILWTIEVVAKYR